MSNASGSPAGTPPSMGAEPELASQTSASHGTVPVTPQTHFSSLLWAINARGSAPATMGTVESNAVSSGPSGSVPRPAGMVQAAMGNSAAGAWSHVPLPRPNVRPVDYGPFAGPSSAAPSYGRPSFVQQGSTGLQAALGGPARPVVVPGQPRPAGQPAPGHMAGGQNAGAAAAANFQAAIQHRIDLSVSTATNAMKQVNARFQSNMVTKQQGHERRVLAAEAAVEALRRDLGECSSTITTMAGSIEKLQQALDSTTQRLADAERKLAGVEATSQASIRTVKSNAEAMAARIGTLEEAQRKMEGETQDLNGTVQAQAATISSLQAALNDSQNQFADMQFRCETLMNDLETLENRHDTLAHNHGALQARTEALETARAAGNDRMAGLQVRIDHLVAESEQNRAASTSATAQIDKLRVDVDDLAGRVESETEVRMLENHAIRSRIVDSSSQGAVASVAGQPSAIEDLWATSEMLSPFAGGHGSSSRALHPATTSVAAARQPIEENAELEVPASEDDAPLHFFTARLASREATPEATPEEPLAEAQAPEEEQAPFNETSIDETNTVVGAGSRGAHQVATGPFNDGWNAAASDRSALAPANPTTPLMAAEDRPQEDLLPLDLGIGHGIGDDQADLASGPASPQPVPQVSDVETVVDPGRAAHGRKRKAEGPAARPESRPQRSTRNDHAQYDMSRHEQLDPFLGEPNMLKGFPHKKLKRARRK